MTTSRRNLLGAGLAATAALAAPVAGRAQDDGTGGPAGDPPAPLLPTNRILSYYGFPKNELMGILGEYGKDDLRALLEQQAAAYQQLDPARPVLLAFELMASVAMRDSGPDNDHLEYTDPDVIDDYVRYTREHGMLLFLDMQFGRNDVERELYKASPWLVEPHVHLALDPEFAVGPDEVPGEVLGSIDAADITRAQQQLADLSTRLGIPPKILLVHQFNFASITNPEQLGEVAGVQFVHEIDGWGDPDMKRETYRVLVESGPQLFHGFKLWYRQDVPLMTEAEVLALDPAPDVIIYQ